MSEVGRYKNTPPIIKRVTRRLRSVRQWAAVWRRLTAVRPTVRF